MELRMPRAWIAVFLAGLVTGCGTGPRENRPDAGTHPLPVRDWRVITERSGPVNYYSLRGAATPPLIRALYHPPLKTTVLGVSAGDHLAPRKLRWRWRALMLPVAGDECAAGRGDSAAAVYVTWKRGLRWYTLKYVWSAVGQRGATCARKRNPLVAQDTIILESGGPLGVWVDEEIDLAAEFRRHFAEDAAELPDFKGLGILTDGDQTGSISAADYAGFVLVN
jgi:hypothetical protein